MVTKLAGCPVEHTPPPSLPPSPCMQHFLSQSQSLTSLQLSNCPALEKVFLHHCLKSREGNLQPDLGIYRPWSQSLLAVLLNIPPPPPPSLAPSLCMQHFLNQSQSLTSLQLSNCPALVKVFLHHCLKSSKGSLQPDLGMYRPWPQSLLTVLLNIPPPPPTCPHLRACSISSANPSPSPVFNSATALPLKRYSFTTASHPEKGVYSQTWEFIDHGHKACWLSC